jgi:hypothetical protein
VQCRSTASRFLANTKGTTKNWTKPNPASPEAFVDGVRNLRRHYLAGVGTMSLGGALVMAAPNLDTNFGVWPFTISMMPG